MRILVVPATATSDAVREVLASWSRSRLLAPFCWWPAPLGPGEDDGGASLRVVRMAGGEEEEGTLAEALAGVDSDDVEIVAVYAATAGESFAPGFVDAIDARLLAAAQVLVHRTGRPLEATMVVAPAEIAQPVPERLFRARWAGNVYVAPEDRSDPAAVNELHENAARLPAHAAHAVATIADLWVKTSFDEDAVLPRLVEEHGTGEETLVHVVRCFSRAIDFGYLPNQLAAATFQPGNAWPNPDGDRFDRVSFPEERIGQLVRQYLTKHAAVLARTPFVPIPLPGPPELSLWEALKRLVRELWARLRRRPREMAANVLNNAHDRVADYLETKRTPESYWRVKRRGRDENVALSDLEEIARQFDRPMIVADGPVREAWVDLRALAFGLIDGSDLPEGIADDVLRAGRHRAVVTDPRLIVPDPCDRPPATPDDPDPRACDPLRLDPRFAVAIADPDAAGDSDPAALEEGGDPAQAAPPEGGDPAQPAPEEVDAASRTPLWQVGASIAAEVLAARTTGAVPPEPTPEERDQRAAEAVERAQAEKKDRRALLRRALRSAALYTAVAGVAGTVVWNELELLLRPPAFALIAFLWLVGIALQARKVFQRDEESALARLREVIRTINEAVERALAAGDAIRLERRYGEYLDWAEVVGWFAHRPWVGERLAAVDLREPIDPDTLPAAFTVAVADADDQHWGDLCAGARQRLFSPRWLVGLYVSAADQALAEAARVADLVGAGGGGAPDPDADTSADVDSPRRQLLERTRRGDGRQLGDVRPEGENAMARGLLELIDSLPLDAAAPSVTKLAAATGTGLGAPTAFLGEIAGAEADLTLLPQHWDKSFRSKPYRVDRVVYTRSDDLAPPTLEAVAGAARFMHPLRAVTSRVDAGGATPARALESCRDSRELDAGHAEGERG